MATTIDRRLTDEQRAVAEANFPLVIDFVKRVYGGGHPKYHDLIQVAGQGLMRAAQKFRPELGFKFATYANYWMRNTTARFLDGDGLIRVPLHAAQDAKAGRGKFVEQAKAASRATWFDPFVSDDRHPTTDDDPALAVETADEREVAVRRLRRGLSRLPERHRDILLRRAAGETLKAIGATWGVSRERIRQIEDAAFDRLRYEMGVTL